MKNIYSAEELYQEMNKLNKDNSVTQFFVPGKGNFTLKYEYNEKTIQEEINEDDALKKVIHKSRRDYKKGRYKSTSEIVESLYKEDV